MCSAPLATAPALAASAASRSPIPQERRKQRSADPSSLSTTSSLKANQSTADAIVLADTSGVVVAGAGSWVICEELAAYAPLFSQSETGLPDRVASLRAECEVREMTAGGQPMLLCAMGKSSARTRAADLASAGVVRILESSL